MFPKIQTQKDLDTFQNKQNANFKKRREKTKPNQTKESSLPWLFPLLDWSGMKMSFIISSSVAGLSVLEILTASGGHFLFF